MKALVLSASGLVSTAQVFPFHLFESDLRDSFGFRFVERPVPDPSHIDEEVTDGYDVVFVQMKIFGRKEEDRLREFLEGIPCPKVLLDDQDSSGRCALSTGPVVDVYLKKQVLRDREAYGLQHAGQRHHACLIEGATVHAPLPGAPSLDAFRAKLYCGWNLGTAKHLYGRLDSLPVMPAVEAGRAIDISLRASVNIKKPEHWYVKHRKRALDVLSVLGTVFKVVSSDEIVDRAAYHRELASSKICLSPWGYGEVCFRDFEVILAGALLVKPSMDHLQTLPNVYVPYETYVPVRPDFSDLPDVCAHYLANEGERRAIASAALEKYRQYFRERIFVQQMGEVIRRLGQARPLAEETPRTGWSAR